MSSIDDSPNAVARVSCSGACRTCAPTRSSLSIVVERSRAVCSSVFLLSAPPAAAAAAACESYPPCLMTACSRPSLWLAACSITVSYVSFVHSL
jgi:hypothetical protein